jgi:hypothetical protein
MYRDAFLFALHKQKGPDEFRRGPLITYVYIMEKS